MNRGSTLFLQAAVVLTGIGVLAFLLWEPHIEGRNANASTFEIYFKDPFLAYVYLGSTPVFVAIYRAFMLLGHARQTGAFSQVTVDSLGTIKRCAMAVCALVVPALIFILMFGDGEDRPAGLFMGLLVLAASGTVAFAAATFARRLGETLKRTGTDNV